MIHVQAAHCNQLESHVILIALVVLYISCVMCRSVIQDVYKDKVDKCEEKVVILPNKPVDASKFEADKIYIQVAAVTAYLDPTETHRVTAYERNFGICM
jgi:hypothetical protein